MVLRLLGFKQRPAPAETPAATPAQGVRRVPQPRTPQRVEFEPAQHVVPAEDSLERAVQAQRYGYVVRQRSQWAGHALLEAAYRAAIAEVDNTFAIVPEGYVTMAKCVVDYPGTAEEDVATQPFLLAKHCVTNQQYQHFVDGGGYQQMDLWPEDVWPHMIGFRDATDHPGPRYWRDGVHNRLLADHPVVGISYFEAAAYARWAGYRLPSGAEWQMAASWHIRSTANILRRYPWGDAFDSARCNVWASCIAQTVPVSHYANGAAPNGVLQLVGNVWEWTDGDYQCCDEAGRPIVGDMLLKEIRGGAFDTYFPAQATSTFRTGLASLTRAHNVGFRCVANLGDDEPAARKGAQP